MTRFLSVRRLKLGLKTQNMMYRGDYGEEMRQKFEEVGLRTAKKGTFDTRHWEYIYSALKVRTHTSTLCLPSASLHSSRPSFTLHPSPPPPPLHVAQLYRGIHGHTKVALFDIQLTPS